MKSSPNSNKKGFISPLAPQIERFLQFKRASGYQYNEEERELRVLDRFLISQLEAKDLVLTNEIVRSYLAQKGGNSDATRQYCLGLLRQLCSFIAVEQPRTFIPPRGFLGICRKPYVPRILTRKEGRQFLQACLRFIQAEAFPFRNMVHGTALILLYLAGMRVGEVLSLNLHDVDLANGILTIRRGKFGKARLIPMSQDLTEYMNRCQLFIDRVLGQRPPGACFFPSLKGSRYKRDALRYSFRKVLANANILYLGKGKGPRLHDLRHSYAIHRMLIWYEQGKDLGAMLPLLSTYLGHVGLSSSQYYLRLTEDLLSEITHRYQKRFNHLIEERS